MDSPAANTYDGRWMRLGWSVVPLTTVLVLTCSGPSSVEKYQGEIHLILDPATRATEERNSVIEEQVQLGVTRLTSQQALEMTRTKLAAANKAYEATSKALTAFRPIVPPKQCEQFHLTITESLQLQRLGLIEGKRFLELFLLTGRTDEDVQEGANRLLAEADRAKQRALFQAGQCK